MKFLFYFLGGVLSVLLLVGGAAFFLVSGDSAVGPPVQVSRPLPLGTGEGGIVRGKLLLPPGKSGMAGRGSLSVGVWLGDRAAAMPVSPQAFFERPNFPLEFKVEIPPGDFERSRPVGSGLQIRAIYCLESDDCSWGTHPSFRARSFLLGVGQGKTVKEAFAGKEEVDAGEVYLGQLFERDEAAGCPEGKRSISGTVDLLPGALARLGRRNPVLFALPIRAMRRSPLPSSTGVHAVVQDLRMQKLNFQGGKAEFSMENLSGDFGYFRFVLKACEPGQPERDCARGVVAEARMQSRYDREVTDITLAVGGYRMPMCGDSGVKLYGFVDNEQLTDRVPEEVRIRLGAGR
jgi:hypothetical protein